MLVSGRGIQLSNWMSTPIMLCFGSQCLLGSVEIHPKNIGSFFGVFWQVMLPRSEGQLQVHAPPALLEHFSEDSSAEVFLKKLVA